MADWEERAEGRVRVAFSQGIATFMICRPEVLNALDLDCIAALDDFVKELGRRPDIAAVVLAGDGEKSFLSGGDLQQFSTLRGERAGKALAGRMSRILGEMEALPQVVIAAIGGDGYGGGVELALACDLRIIERSSRLALTQSRFGLTTAWGGAVRLVRMMGAARTMEILLETPKLSAEEALALGLVNRIVDDGQAVAQAQQMAMRIVSLGGAVSAGVKRVVRFAENLSPDEAMAEERRVFAKLWGSALHEARGGGLHGPKTRSSRPLGVEDDRATVLLKSASGGEILDAHPELILVQKPVVERASLGVCAGAALERHRL